MNLSELKQYFESATIPAYPMKINTWLTIHPEFLPSKLTMAEAGDKRAVARLQLFHDYLEGLKNPPAETGSAISVRNPA
ncbi:DUF6965 family protein [Spirosoma spitsbergense]|uniref:DUF6965 family protein n=1 Tax=Spirosoma spitsbergense TaxID=431554 RepID=UPI00036720C1|nr:hypothetical protein [Spirosoma spitsbergense]